jgi:hypothetical protein
MSLPLHRCCLPLLAAISLAASAQQPASHPLDQKSLLTQARNAYYLPIPRGVQGFACTVAFDWADVLERASGRKIPSKEPTLVALRSANVTVTDDIAKGVTVQAVFPHGAPPVNSPVATRQRILTNLIKASLGGWNPFLSDQIFPMKGTKYRFEPAAAGYRLTLEGGTFFSILDLDSQFRLTHGESHLNGTATDFTPTFDPSTHGWLITSLKTTTTQAVATTTAEMKASGATSSSAGSAPSASADTNPDANTASFTYTYQFVEDILIPKHVTVQYAGGLETPYDLTDCTLIKTPVPVATP